MSFTARLIDFNNRNPKPKNESSILGLLFPADSEFPKFIWVRRALSTKIYDGHPSMREEVMIQEYVKNPRQQVMSRNGYNTLNLWCTMDMFSAYSALNQSIRACSERVMKRDWRGDIIVMSSCHISAEARFDGTGELIDTSCENIRYHQDITPSDCEVAIKYFQNNGYWYGQNPLDLQKRQHQIAALPDVIRGVEIRCDGELAANEYEDQPTRFISADIQSNQLMMIRGDVSEIVQLLGLSIYVFKISDPETWLNNAHYDPTNYQAATLMMGADPEILPTEKHSGWGIYDLKYWDLEAGNVHVVRKDGKPITPMQVEALSVYCREQLAPKMSCCANNVALPNPEDDEVRAMIKDMIEKGMKVSGYAIRREITKRFISRAKFEEFFADFQETKIILGETDWKHALSPLSY